MADDIILVNGIILTDPGSSQVQPHGKTVISGERLAQVNVSLDEPAQGAMVIDCAHCLIMPGLINGHTHGAMSLLRGLADDVPLDQWLTQYIFPAEAKYVGPEFVYLGTMISAVEMALSGVTTFADGYFFMESAARAALDVGLRAVIAQGVLDVPSPDAPSPGSWKQRAEAFLASCPTDSLISPALFCHSPYLCGPQTFQAAADLARSHGTLLFSHVSETAAEVEDMQKRYGKRSVEHLRDLDVLGKSFVAVHAVHVDDSEMDILAESGTGVIHCPESNMKLAAGACRSWELLRRGIALGIGTDGAASNNNLDLFEELRTASLVAKLMTKDPESLGASAAVKMATADGARALGMGDEIGTLTKGKLADVVVIDLDRPHLTPVYDPVSHLIYSARGSDVRDVIVNGKLVVRQGKMVTVDEQNLKARAGAMASKIGRELGATYGGAYTGNVGEDHV